MTPDKLRAAGRTPPAPVNLALDDGSTLTIERWLRILPGKRLTGIGTWQGRTVLAKLFVAARGSRRHWQREREGAARLQAQKLPTPSTFAAGSLENGGYYLLYDYLAPAYPPDPAVTPELMQAFTLLGQLHARGLIHEDAHLDNFLLANSQAYVIDGDAVRPATRPTDHTANLALLFAQLVPDAEAALRAPLLTAYRTGHPAAEIDSITLSQIIARTRASRLRDYLDKTLRDCSLFKVTQTATRFTAVVRTLADRLAPLLADPDAWLEKGLPLKRGRTATLARIEIDGLPLVIKRYNIKGAIHALSRAWRPSRAWHAWREGHRLGFLGIPTPQPLALIERRVGPLRSTAWLITEYCPGQDMARHLAASLDTPSTPEFAALESLCEKLVAARISHGDLKATNLLWHEGRINLIDLDATHQHTSAPSFTRAWRKDRTRLLQNWPANSAVRLALDASLPDPDQ